jgi:predicted nucleotidyltransferase
VIELPDCAGHASDLWNALIDIGHSAHLDWVLVGGQMVLLHAIEQNAPWPRVSMDLDVIVNARIVSSVRDFVTTLETLGFELDGMSPEMLAHRYRRGAASIDVLAPEGLSERTSLVTTPPGHTLQVPGGTQALQRAELVEVSFSGRSGWIRRPSLLGAIVGKACAVDVDDAKQNQELDLAMLLTFVADPFAMRQELTAKDRQRIGPRRTMLDPDHRVWQSMDGNEAESARTALAVLLG